MSSAQTYFALLSSLSTIISTCKLALFVQMLESSLLFSQHHIMSY